MDTKKKIFSEFMRQKMKARKFNGEKPNFIKKKNNECHQINNGCLTRFKLIETRLNDVLSENYLPCFEDIVQHLRRRRNEPDDLIHSTLNESTKQNNLLLNDIDDDSSHEFMEISDLDVSIISNKSTENYNEAFPIKNPEFLLKELLLLVSQFLQMDDRPTHQYLIEKATVYLLWVFYESFHHLETSFGNIEQPFTNLNFSNISSHYTNLEYIFCLDPLNFNLIEKMCFFSRSLFQLMEPKYMSQIFFYPSIIKEAINDIENQEPNYDWFQHFTEDNFNNDLLSELINPFEIGELNYMLITEDDKQLIRESSEDLAKFNFEYSNSELILQNLLYFDSIQQHSAITVDDNNNKFKNNLNCQNEQLSITSSIQNDMDSIKNQSTEDVLSSLYAELSLFIIEYNSRHDDVFYLNNEELYNTILNCLINSTSDNILSEELTNLLGEDSMKLITKIITCYKPKVKSNLNSSMESIQAKQSNTKRAEQLWKMIRKAKDTGSVSVRPSIVVQTTKEKALKKEMRKIEKKYNKELSKSQKNPEMDNQSEKLTLQDLERMREQNIKDSIRSVLEQNMKKQLRQYRPIEKYPFVYDLYQSIKTTASYIAETKLMLPLGSEKKDFKTYEEVIIPIMSSNEETKAFLQKFHQIDINDTDEFVKTAFQGFQKLNIIQSAVFQTAYQSDNQNMLICAPTGAGKTNIAMLAILNILRSFSSDQIPNSIELDQFKIIYIAPMKALCAEMTATFGQRLQPFGVKVRELTGDMQMTSKEIMETQILVVTPEKWDVVTRKSVGDVQLMDLVRLIIIDEVHLLQSDRGHVLETLVARTVRYVEQAQKYIRLIGLSATLPNYIDVAQFLHVDLYKGLYVFDDRFRPVPLLKTFIGCKSNNKSQLNTEMDEITFMKAKEILKKEFQVMIFVHSRNATMQLANFLLEKSQYNNPNDDNACSRESLQLIFQADTAKLHGSDKLISKARYRNLNKFLLNGIGIHHAGMPRSERNVVEKLFSHGVIKVLVCTSTLAWGVNLPAHSVIIRGTEYYDPAQGYYVNIDMLDVMQIFGRAGRPQFDSDGEATIITKHECLPHYLSMLTNQLPIESRFLKRITDNLNAEIVLGTVSNISEAVEWLKYTYLYIRMQKNPMEYGLKSMASLHYHLIIDHLTSLVKSSAEQLDCAQMIRYNPEGEGTLDATHLGRIASHYYIQHETIVHFNENLKEVMDIGNIFDVMAQASEFQQLRCREEEIEHLQYLCNKCVFHFYGDLTNTHTKVNILMQCTIGRVVTECHSLNSDMMYIHQNIPRLTRGLFEYVIRKGWPSLAEKFLDISLMFEKRIWNFDTPLYQFESELPSEVLDKLSSMQKIRHYNLKEMDINEISQYIRNKKYAPIVKRLTQTIPNVLIEASVKPITRTILTIYINIKPDFIWDDKYHGKSAQIYWIWLTDIENNHIYHAELGRFTKKQVVKEDNQHYVFTIPILDAEYFQKQYLIYCAFEYWLGSVCQVPVSCHNLILPDKHLPNTKLLDLMPLPIKALQNEIFQSIYSFTHFNPIQTQIFHTLYHTDHNVLLGAPTGSGKTIAAEIALFRAIKTNPNGKIVYIAPLKALVRERIDDWKTKMEQKIGLCVVELTGDVTPDLATINSANVIVTTPEKWDGVSRGWTFRKFVRQVTLIIIDEIHLLGEERGPVLEVIVSRANFICRRTGENIRIVGLSTAIANAQDLSAWLGIKNIGLYNFSSSVRPVPIEVHVSGFYGKHYCPRMASMNKPAYRAIKQYSPTKPVIVFVSSRRQTRLTALDLITLIASDDHSTGLTFLHIKHPDEIDSTLKSVKDSYLKHTLRFGIGMHHAGLIESDRKLVEQLFSERKIQILITTATLAWGINLPAHAVIIKGTEFFDGKKNRYVDFPITDVLQMIGRAGRPQFDTSAVAILFVHDIKKEYYRKFLYEPFPVESHLLDVFPDHLNAEIMAGTVKTKNEAMEYLSSTYFYHRIIKNPSYYGVDLPKDTSQFIVDTQVVKFLSSYIDSCVQILLDNYCIQVQDIQDDSTQEQFKDELTINSNQILSPTPFGKIASFYYLSYKTIKLFQDRLSSMENESRTMKFSYFKINELLDLLTQATEYATLPVRHNEETLNQQLSQVVPIKLDRRSMDSPHTKANLLIQAHCSRAKLPIVDYYTDLKTVLDQVIRIMQAMIDISAINGSLPTTINIINLQQNIIQASWQHSNQLLILLKADIDESVFISDDFNSASQYYSNRQLQTDSAIYDVQKLPSGICSLPVLLHFIHKNGKNSENAFKNLFNNYSIHHRIVSRIYKSLLNLPLINLEKITIKQLKDYDQDQEEKNISNFFKEISKENTFRSRRDLDWIKLKPNTDYLLCCQLRRISLNTTYHSKNNKSDRAFCPSFPKPKSESWYLILGLQENSELITITRVPYINHYSTQINIYFRTPDLNKENEPRRTLYTLYLLSDCYIGLDQQYSLPLLIN